MTPDEQDQTIAQFQIAAAPILARFTAGADVVHPVSANLITARA